MWQFPLGLFANKCQVCRKCARAELCTFLSPFLCFYCHSKRCAHLDILVITPTNLENLAKHAVVINTSILNYTDALFSFHLFCYTSDSSRCLQRLLSTEFRANLEKLKLCSRGIFVHLREQRFPFLGSDYF